MAKKLAQGPEDVVLQLVTAEASSTSIGLAFVPAVVEQAMSLGLTMLRAQQALLRLATDEVVELRPESGLGRLTQHEVDLCPTTRDYLTDRQVPLSWARLR